MWEFKLKLIDWLPLYLWLCLSHFVYQLINFSLSFAFHPPPSETHLEDVHVLYRSHYVLFRFFKTVNHWKRCRFWKAPWKSFAHAYVMWFDVIWCDVMCMFREFRKPMFWFCTFKCPHSSEKIKIKTLSINSHAQ